MSLKENSYKKDIINLNKDITLLKNKMKVLENKLNNRYCPKLLQDVRFNNSKTLSFLESVKENQTDQINGLNKNIKEYKTFSDNYGVKNEPAISNSLDYLNTHLQLKSFNDNATTLEMMQDTLEFSNQVPPMVSEEEEVRLYPFKFTDFNGSYSINLGNFNHNLINNKHTINININNNNPAITSIQNNNNLLNTVLYNKNSNIDDEISFGNIKLFDDSGESLLNFKIMKISHAELPKFPTTTIFMYLKSKIIYDVSNKILSEEEKILKNKKIKLLNELGLKEGGIYLHGNDGKFNLYAFNKLFIFNMSPI